MVNGKKSKMWMMSFVDGGPLEMRQCTEVLIPTRVYEENAARFSLINYWEFVLRQKFWGFPRENIFYGASQVGISTSLLY